MTTKPQTLLPLPDPPERESDDMTSFHHLTKNGGVHHLIQHLGDPDTTIVEGERSIIPEPGAPASDRLVPDLLIAFNADPATYRQDNGYVLSRQGKPPDFVMEIASPSTGRQDEKMQITRGQLELIDNHRPACRPNCRARYQELGDTLLETLRSPKVTAFEHTGEHQAEPRQRTRPARLRHRPPRWPETPGGLHEPMHAPSVFEPEPLHPLLPGGAGPATGTLHHPRGRLTTKRPAPR